MQTDGKLHAPAALSPGKIVRVEGWVGPRVSPYSKERRKTCCPYPELTPDFSIVEPIICAFLIALEKPVPPTRCGLSGLISSNALPELGRCPAMRTQHINVECSESATTHLSFCVTTSCGRNNIRSRMSPTASWDDESCFKQGIPNSKFFAFY
jgi:hypothetical protein